MKLRRGLIGVVLRLGYNNLIAKKMDQVIILFVVAAGVCWLAADLGQMRPKK
jgi:hypothetical protein